MSLHTVFPFADICDHDFMEITIGKHVFLLSCLKMQVLVISIFTQCYPLHGGGVRFADSL